MWSSQTLHFVWPHVVVLGVLGLGLGLLERWPTRAGWILLAGYPISVGAAIAVRSHAQRTGVGVPNAMGPETGLGLLFTAASMMIFCAFVAKILSKAKFRLIVQTSSLENERFRESHFHRRDIFQRLLLGVGCLGSLALALVAPIAGSDVRVREAWGPSAAGAQLLATIVGGILSISVLALFIGPNLRADRSPKPTSTELWRRAILFSLAAGFGIFTYLVLRRSE